MVLKCFFTSIRKFNNVYFHTSRSRKIHLKFMLHIALLIRDIFNTSVCNSLLFVSDIYDRIKDTV